MSCDGISPMGWDADRGWSRIRRVPGSIPGTAGSDLLSYFFFGFLNILGYVWDTFSDNFLGDAGGQSSISFLDMHQFPRHASDRIQELHQMGRLSSDG